MTTTPQWILVTIVATLMVQYGSAVELKIVSFNIEKFGRSENLWVNVQNKQLNNNAISQNAKIFAMILQQYDIIFLQEIQGETNRGVINEIKAILNWVPMQIPSQQKPVYEVVWPDCFFDAQGNYETYVYYINTNKIPNGRWEHGLYPSPGRLKDTCRRPLAGPQRKILFARPPYGLCLKNAHGNCVLFLLGLHAKPLGTCSSSYHPGVCTTREELDNLVYAYEYFADSKVFNTRYAVLMGDFNADGRYLTYAQLLYLDLSKRECQSGGEQGWMSFSGTKHTNVNDNHPAMYDRFYVTFPPRHAYAVVQKDARVKLLSDHYPIAITFNWDF